MIRVVCTGKETHRELFFQLFDFAPLASMYAAEDRLQWETYEGWREVRIESFRRRPLKKTYTFTCRRCTPIRETQMKRKTLVAALDGLRAAEQETLDISKLPF